MSLPFEPRDEDRRLLTGAGRFCDDERGAGRGACACLSARRMPLPRSAASTPSAARRLPGVLAVLTAADMEAAGVGNVTLASAGAERRRARRAAPAGAGRRLRPPCRRARRAGRRRNRGDRARRAPNLSRSITSRAIRSPMSRPPSARTRRSSGPRRRAISRSTGTGSAARRRARAVAPVFAGAAHVARVRLVNQRIVMAPMEPRGALARYDARERPLHPVLRLAERLCAAAELGALHGVAARAHARRQRRCRRRVRHARDRLSGISGAAPRGPADRPRRCAGWPAAPRDS